MTDPVDRDTANRVAVFDHLTGPSRGSVSWVVRSRADIEVDAERRVHVGETGGGAASPSVAARLQQVDGGFEIEAVAAHALWVNGAPTRRSALKDGDIVEFGETGPMSRFRIYDDRHPVDHTLTSIVQDSLAYFATSRRPLGRRLLQAAFDLTRRVVFEMKTLFRVTIVVAIVTLAVILYRQHLVDVSLRESIERSAVELESVSSALARAQAGALQQSDLAALREEFGRRVSSNIERLEALEAEGGASARVIAGALQSVALLQAAYGIREVSSGRYMRLVLSNAGYPIIGPTGQPLISLDGTGPTVEIQTIGTGFVLEGGGALLTNKHLALPWQDELDLDALAKAGLEPTVRNLLAYFPKTPAAMKVELAAVSETSDLALVRPLTPFASGTGLPLARETPAAGEKVIVMGYPTGLRAILAQSGRAFVENLETSGETDFWSVARRLAEAGLIAPLASEGIVAHASATAIVYDADTTHGGSGGPVLNMKGEVIAITSAILPEYGGANFGVPAAKAQELLDALGSQ